LSLFTDAVMQQHSPSALRCSSSQHFSYYSKHFSLTFTTHSHSHSLTMCQTTQSLNE
jgi:hypothetical protein